jgi:gluconolactonase
LTGKRLFARAAKGVPKGIICDKSGNVFAGCGDGVEIWNPGGILLGVIAVPGERTTSDTLMPGSIH